MTFGKRSPHARPYRQLDTLQTLLRAGVVAILGLALLYVGARESWWQNHAAWERVLTELGAFLIVSAALGALWELAGKRSFAREMFEVARLSTDVHDAGLARIGTSWLEDPDWRDMFAGARNVDIFFAYGRTWRHNNWPHLKVLSQSSGAVLRVFLPDPTDDPTVNSLARAFSMTNDELKAAVQDSIKEFTSLGGGAAHVQIYVRKGESTFSCYRFDKTAVLTLYSHRRERTNVPTIVTRDGGHLYKFVNEELLAILGQSSLHYDSKP